MAAHKIYEITKLLSNLSKYVKKSYLAPTSANVKLANRSGNKKLKLKLPQIVMEAELQQKHQEKSKVKEEITSVDITL